MASARPLDLAALKRELRSELPGEALLDPEADAGAGSIEPYARDESFLDRYPPDLVVRPSTTDEVRRVIVACRRNRVPVTPRGGGTGKSGGALAVEGGVVLSLERMRRVRDVVREDLYAVVEPGVVTGELMRLVEAEGLFYPPDPNSLDACTIGGNVACNAGGPRVLKYGATRPYVLGLTAVLPTGEVVRAGGRTIKRACGYDLVGLIVGSEGTLAVITEVTLRLLALPAHVETALVSFGGMLDASRAVARVIAGGIVPRTLELLDRHALAAVRQKTPGRFPDAAGACLILEVDGDDAERALGDLTRAADACTAAGATEVLVAQGAAQRARIWEPRRELSCSLAATAKRKISEDVVVPRSRIPELCEAVEAIGERHRVKMASYGHAGDGNLHVNFLFDDDSAERAEQAVEELMRATVGLGGTISGEHGVGLTKRRFLAYELAPEAIALQRRLKAAVDPDGILNPGKIFPAGGPRE